MEEILTRAARLAEAVDVFSINSDSTSVQFEANRLKHVQGKQSTTIAVRLVKNGRIGYASASGENTAGLVEMALETAQFGQPAKFELPEPAVYPKVSTYDRTVPKVTPEQMIALGEELIAPLRADTTDIICGAGVGRSTITVTLVNSKGLKASYRKTAFSMGVEGTVVRGTDMLFVGEGDSSCHPLLKAKPVVEMVLQQLAYAKTMASVASKTLPVIFTPNGAASALMPALMAAFNGKLVLEGASPIGKRLGEKVFDTCLSLWDNATLPYRPESRPCDEEGVPSQRTLLIENGVVANFLYDLQTAAMAGKRSTGSASRDRGLPSPAPSAFVFGTGQTSFADMVGGMKEGLVVEQLMGAEQGNVLGGDFSGNVLLGYKVENGQIVGRVKDTMVSGNVYQILKEVVLGQKGRWVSGSLFVPHIYCPGLSVASK